MKSLQAAFLVGLSAGFCLLFYVLAACGRMLVGARLLLLHGSLVPGSRLNTLCGFFILWAGLVTAVTLASLVVVRGMGRRSSGAMLRETQLNARQRGIPGMEELQEGR